MCGILGIINFNGHAVERKSLLQSMDLLANRGPDDHGIWIQGPVALAHRRLAILDTSSAGHQPMESADKRYVIVFNGEIYNFKELRHQLNPGSRDWYSNSDTEVVLEAYRKWGEDCVQHFRGMFSFAIFDRNDNIMFAARDRMGIKPFYYSFSDSAFVFASRPRALFPIDPDISREIDEEALRLYFECGYIPAPYSIHRQVRKLPPATTLVLADKKMTMNRYWDFRNIQVEPSWAKRREDDLLDELQELTGRCVHSRMISDVPLGAFLSGGIDSSLVVALMAKKDENPVTTFTIAFNEKEFDESLYAGQVAEGLGTNHHCIPMKVDDLYRFLPDFNEQFDEPFADAAAFPMLALSRLARRHVTVALSGDGADELFGGYHYYRISRILHYIYYMPISVRRWTAKLLKKIQGHKYQLMAASLMQTGRIDAYAFTRSIAKDFELPLSLDSAMRTADNGIARLFNVESNSFPTNLESGEEGMRLDLAYTLPGDYLQKIDVASMAYSLEARTPLLDHELVEWAMKLPVSWKLRGKTNKYLLRKLAYRMVPQHLLDRPKQGFVVPIGRWLRGPLKEWAMDKINDTRNFHNLPLNPDAVQRLWQLHLSGERNVQPLLWAVLMLLDFQKKHL